MPNFKALNSKFTLRLLDWYQHHKRSLPWRETRDPYKIWVSEVMLQQTTVKAVLGYYQKWIKRFPTVAALAKASEQQVLKSWQGLGYYNRARNLHRAAQVIQYKFRGRVPQSEEELKELPGFGPYTVGAVLSIAYNIPVPIIDANIRRLFMRLLAIRGPAVPSADKDILPKIKQLVPERRPGEFNQGLMEIGALICTPKEPVCNQCPINQFCAAYRRGLQEVIPKPKSQILHKIKAVVAVINNSEGRILIQKRPDKGLLAGMWEFPGGKIERKEAPRTALVREIREELGQGLVIYNKIYSGTHYYTKYKVMLLAYRCRLEGKVQTESQVCWVRLKELKEYPMPSGSAKIVDILQAM